MDGTPIDLDALTRLVNDLFRGDPGLAGMTPASGASLDPAQTDITRPDAARPSAPIPDRIESVGAPGVTGSAGGATPSLAASPTRPSAGAPFPDAAPARHFAGPIPVTGVSPIPSSPFGYDLPAPATGLKDLPHAGDSFPEEAELRALLAQKDASGYGIGGLPTSSAAIPQSYQSAPYPNATGPHAFGAAAPAIPAAYPAAASPPPVSDLGSLTPGGINLDMIPHINDGFPGDAELKALLSARDPSQYGPGALGAAPAALQGLGSVPKSPQSAPRPDTAVPQGFGTSTDPFGITPMAVPQAPGIPGSAGLNPSPAPSFYFINEGYFADDVPKAAKSAGTIFEPGMARKDFPIFKQRVNGYPLIWLDNGATTQKPQAVIDRVSKFYEEENSNIHRAAHELAARATDAYEDARKTVQRFINAASVEELVFVRGTTEGINFIAQSYGRRFIGKGDEIVITHFEHHANIVPWYLLAKETGAVLRVAPVDDHGNIILDEYERLLNGRTKIVSMTQVSNALGTVLPVKAMTEMAHRHGIPVVVDGAQSISHMPIDVQDIDCDFFVFSGHKVFAPTGIGAVYGKKAILDQMPPWQGGGNMIKDVTFEKIEFQPAPFRFEAGTGNIADAVGLGEALKYLERIGMANIMRYEHDILDYALHRLREIRSLRIIGNPTERAGVISLLIDGLEPLEVGKALNQKGIAVRAGHHCAQPILRRFGVEATVRPSFALYNTFEDVDRLAEALYDIAINRAQ
ncbi:MAG: SufS family cysteine desulfurase [Beijerinckiaceae bacterium]|nr:SufS family cysteine desulfurase [Beijerinckiaceae bacterium]